MDMSPEEFDEAAHRLLQAEQDGSINLPAGGGIGGLTGALSGAAALGGGRGRGGGHGGWGDDDFDTADETMPLRSGPVGRFDPRGVGGGSTGPQQGEPQAPTRSRNRRGNRGDTNV